MHENFKLIIVSVSMTNRLLHIALLSIFFIIFHACKNKETDNNKVPIQETKQNNLNQTIIQELNGHAYVDLGLSVNWATCNIGAEFPEEYGDYFAWGETTINQFYTWESYKYKSMNINDINLGINKYNKTDGIKELELSDDAAHVQWGEGWRMPTLNESKELCEKCIWIWKSLNGVNGYEIKGTNGNTIFIPAAGYYHGSGLSYEGSLVYCWSSSLSRSYPHCACSLSSNTVFYLANRCYGQSIRAVCDK